MHKTDWRGALLWPVTVPAAYLGLMYFIIARRHPPRWLLKTFGALIAVAIVWAISRLLF